jgi:hypothetical protein
LVIDSKHIVKNWMTGLKVGSFVKVDHFFSELVKIDVATADVGLEKVFLASVIWGSDLVNVFTIMI